jgi:hypothetical protein
MIGNALGGWVSTRPSPLRRIPRAAVILSMEVLAVALWTAFIGMDYLDFDPGIWPQGEELITNAQSHAMWVALERCGLCFLWNGSVNGGAPSFVEVLGAPFHPLVMLPTLVFGFINGIKATLLLSLALAGLAQIWLGRILKLHPVVRIWCAGIAVAGGYLSGRMEDGLFQLVLSTAACSLVIPAFLQFLLSSSRRNTVFLSLTLASAFLAGQGYMQIGFAFSVLPGFVLLGFLIRPPRFFPWKKLLFSASLAVLLTAFFLVPLAHFLPLFQKHTDPALAAAQPLQYLPLNLVISDPRYYHTGDLGKLEFIPYMYANYIGWLPVLLAVFACTLRGRRVRKTALLFLGTTVLVYLAASGWTLRLLSVNKDWAGIVRYPSVIAGLAPPLILGMAGLGMQAVWAHRWPTYTLRFRDSTRWLLRIPLRAAVIVITLIAMGFSLASVAEFSLRYLVAQPADKIPLEIFQAIPTTEIELVQTPFLEYGWFPYLFDRGLKIPAYLRAWDIKSTDKPEPRFLILPRPQQPQETTGWFLARQVGNYRIYKYPNRYYAVLHTSGGDLPCSARGMWGNLDVACQSEQPGILSVMENNYDGWRASVDGTPVSLGATNILTVSMPAGSHTASLRFRPWDVPLGIALSAAGWILLAVYLRRGKKEAGLEKPASG